MHRNEAHGFVNGPLVQAGYVQGDVNIQQQLRPSDQRLRDALAKATVNVGRGKGVVVAEDLVLTCVELAEEHDLPTEPLGETLALARIELGKHSAACLAVEVSDQLLELSTEVGSPVLNPRTGAVCGVYDGTDVVTLPSIPEHVAAAGRANHAWLDLLDADQLREGGWRHAGERLRQYLKAIGAAGEEHAYRFLRALTPSLSSIYVARKAVRSSEVDEESEPGVLERLRADELLRHHLGVQIVNAPGMGKSSLVRRLTADAAQNWLEHGSDEFVPVLVQAETLTLPEPLPNALAKGTTRWFGSSPSSQEIVDLFAREPIPDIPWLILVDGLDEIAGRAERHEVLRKITEHRDDLCYRFVVTSRPLKHNDIGRIERINFPTYKIEPFTEAELEQFATRFLAAQDGTSGGSAVDFMARVQRTKMYELARIPLISTMLCTLYGDQPSAELPQNQSQLYSNFLEWTQTKRNELDVRSKLRTSVSGGGPSAATAVNTVMDRLDELLQHIAYRRQRLDEQEEERSALDDAVSWAKKIRPDGLSSFEWTGLLSDALRQSGLLVQTGENEFEFLHKTVEEYLAARALANQHFDPSWRTVHKLLGSRQETLERQVKVFLAAHWIANGVDLNRYLRRMLWGRHWKANIGFMTELVQHGVRFSDERLQRKAERLLCREVRKHSSPAMDWKDAVEQLGVINRELALRELKKLAIRDKTPDGRCLEALRELIRFKADGTLPLVEAFLTHQDVTEQLRNALVEDLHQYDQEVAATLMIKIADDNENSPHKVDAAQKLLGVDSIRGVAKLSEFATSYELDDSSRAKATESVLAVAPKSHVWILPVLLRELKETAPWKQAAELLHEHDATGLEEVLAEITGSTDATPTRHYEAASMLVDKFEKGHDLLLDAAGNRQLDQRLRIKAVALSGKQKPQIAENIVLNVLNLAQSSDPFRVKAMEALLPINSSRAHTELTKLAREDVQSADDRLHAVELGAGRSNWEKTDICVRIARARGNFDPRLKAAHTATELNQSWSEQAFRGIVEDPNISEQKRIDAAIAPKRNRSVVCSGLLTTLAQDQSVSPDGRLQAAERLGRFNFGKFQQVLLEMVGDNRLSQTHRIRAAKKSKKKADAVTLLLKIASGRGNDHTRMEAAHVLAGLDRPKAADAFRQIETGRKASRRAREEARKEAEKLDRR